MNGMSSKDDNKEFYDKYYPGINVASSAAFSVFFLVYFFAALSYFRNNLIKLKTSNAFTLWLRLLYSILNVFLFTVIFMVNCLLYSPILQKEEEKEKEKEEKNHPIQIIAYFLFVNLIIVGTLNAIIDVYKNYQAIRKIRIMLKVEAKSYEEMVDKLKKINFADVVQKQSSYYETGVVMFLNAILLGCFSGVFFCIFFQTKETIEDGKDARKKAYNIFFFVIKLLQIFAFAVLWIFIYIMKNYKVKLLENTYHSTDLRVLKMYNMNSSMVIFITDFMICKSINDFLFNFPFVFFSALNHMTTLSIAISYICFLFSFVIGGCIYLQLDKKPKLIQRGIKFLFLYNKFSFNFGEKEKEKLYEIGNSDYTEIEEKKEIYQELNMTIINRRTSNAIIPSDSKRQTLIDTFVQIDSNGKEMPNQNKNSFELNSPSNYFVVLKLIFLYFTENKAVYIENAKKMNEEALPFKKLHSAGTQTKNEPPTLSNAKISRSKDFFERISRLSRISRMNEKKLTTSLKVKIDRMFNSIEEKEHRENFLRQYKILPKDFSSINFTIETLYNSSLSELFPFYQINIKDILNALDPSTNKNLFSYFTSKSSKGKTPSPIIISKSEFFTHDSFLSFEVFEPNEILSTDLKNFIDNYHDYLLDTIKEVSYTFLPIIIGVYNITFNQKSKIVVMYRHPIGFAMNKKFNHWINFEITEAPEKIKVSTEAELIDFNEIEVKNNMKLSSDDYEEVKNILKNDIEFIIKKMNLKTFPIINLFVGNEILVGENLELSNDVNFMNTSKESENKNLSTLIQGAFNFDNSLSNIKVKVREGGSELLSLLEKEIFVLSGDNRYTIKIYFSNFFRKTCALNEKETDEKKKVDSTRYCDYIKNQLLSYLTKTPNIFNISGLSNSKLDLSKSDGPD